MVDEPAMSNHDYPMGTEFEITLRVKSEFLWMDEAEIINEFFRWQTYMNQDDTWADISIVPGSMRASAEKIPEL